MNNTADNKSVWVWDKAVRLFHWSLVVGFFVAYFAEGEWLRFHIWAGYGVFGLITFRLVWGFIGTRFARFNDFVYAPGTVLSYLSKVFKLKAPRYRGHNPAGGAMIIALLLSVFFTTWTGVLLYGGDAWLGPMAWLMKNGSSSAIKVLDETHALSANITVALIAIHVGGVLWESLLHKENLVKSMFTGYKPLSTDAQHSKKHSPSSESQSEQR